MSALLGLGMPAVLLEHEGEVLPDELRTRDAAFASRAREQPIALRIEGDGRPFFRGTPTPLNQGDTATRNQAIDHVSGRRVRQDVGPDMAAAGLECCLEDGKRRPTWLNGTTNG